MGDRAHFTHIATPRTVSDDALICNSCRRLASPIYRRDAMGRALFSRRIIPPDYVFPPYHVHMLVPSDQREIVRLINPHGFCLLL